MTGSQGITGEDVRRLLALVERPVAKDAEELFYSEVLCGLRELIPCDDITFQLMDVGRKEIHTLTVTDAGIAQAVDDDEPAGSLDVFWSEFWLEHGCAGPLVTGDYDTFLGTHLLDARSFADHLASPMGATLSSVGLRHELLVPMRPRGSLDRRLLLFRGEGPPFSECERTLLRLIRPHLSELHQRRERELSGRPELTARQWEVLRRVSAGHSNAQIARMLGVSQATVRKHLENAYVRLHVASRTEASHRVRDFIDIA